MNRKSINKTTRFTFNIATIALMLVLQMTFIQASAQEPKTATVKLTFSNADTSCIATVISDSAATPAKDVDVHLYVKGMYALLPIGKAATTDENGQATISFPKNLPGDPNDMITVVAKVEKDAKYGSFQTEGVVKWGVKSKSESYNWSNRSLSASRERAPMILVVASTLIIMFIWGTIFYVVSQLFKIKKSARPEKSIAAA
jgi:hypothetical protein